MRDYHNSKCAVSLMRIHKNHCSKHNYRIIRSLPHDKQIIDKKVKVRELDHD